jgi:hypothetical protein
MAGTAPEDEVRLPRLQFCLLFIVLRSFGCSSTRNIASTDEMMRVQAAFGDLQNGLDAGVSDQEFTQQVHTALARIGDLQNSEKVAEIGLPKDKVALVYGYFGREATAYAMSTQFLGDRWDELQQTTTDSTSDDEKQSLSLAFPELYVVDIMSRRNVVRDLLILAKDERDDASDMIETL